MKNLKWIVVIASAKLLFGCAMSDRQGDLGLNGYRSVRVADFTVSEGFPYNEEKFAERSLEMLNKKIQHGAIWADTGSPQAVLTIAVTSFDQPSKASRVINGTPAKIHYLIRAHDAKTKLPLGELTGKVKIGGGQSVIIDPMAITYNLMLEQVNTSAFQETSYINLATDIYQGLDDARRRPAPALTRPSEMLVKPELAPEQTPTNRQGRLVAQAEGRR